MISEMNLIRWLEGQLGRSRGRGVGDDAAVFDAPSRGKLIITSDAIIDRADFHIAETGAAWIGRKALAVNLSDSAAMGAIPKRFVVTLGLPPRTRPDWVRRCYRGMLRLAERYRVECIGGDITKSRDVFLSVTLIGECGAGGPVLRSGARPGDLLAVTGALGGSIRRHHLAFEPRVAEGAFLAANRYARAMIDISDGFARDLDHILRKSKVGARIDLEKIPVSRDALKKARGSRRRALRHALSDGEDFELLFAVPKKKAVLLERSWTKRFPGTRLSWVGEFQKGSGVSWCEKGKRKALNRMRKGYDHFA